MRLGLGPLVAMLLARLGKRTLRPGGMELTQQMLELLGVQRSDEVVEFAPGLGGNGAIDSEPRPRPVHGH